MTFGQRYRTMKRTFLFLSALFLSGALFGQNLVQSSHSVVIKGTSNLHDWQSKATVVKSTGTATFTSGTLADLKNFTVTVPVKKIESGKDLMDTKTFEAFNEPKKPNITFTCSDATVNGPNVSLKGNLTMNGVTLPATVVAQAKWANGQLTLTGSHTVDMVAFKMRPPEAVMGTIKVGPKVTIVFQTVYSIQKPQS